MRRNPLLILTLVLAAPLVKAQTTTTSSTILPTTNGRVSPAPLSGDPMTTTNVVPSGFSPLTATAAQLAAYGFPPQPTSPQALATWTKAMQTAITQVIPTATTNTGHVHGPVSISQGGINLSNVTAAQLNNAALTNPAAIGSYNWSGYLNLTPESGTQFSEVWAEIEVPRAEQAVGTCVGQTYSSQWVGLDGDGSPDVLQTGAEADTSCNDNVTSESRTYVAWYEWYPLGEVHINGFPIHSGDDLFIAVWATSPTTGNIFIVNYHSGLYVSLTLTPSAGTQLQGNSAEYVVEAPSVNGTVATLTHYGADYFTSVYAQDNSGNPYDLSAVGATPIIMVDSNNNPISYPTLLGTNAIYLQDYGSAW